MTSYRKARRKLSYETWWTVHLYTYFALALALSHQIATGASFVGHPLARLWWMTIWAGTAGVALAYRVFLPILRSAYHRLRVVSVHHEGPGVVSIVCKGHRLDRLPLHGGQFMQWRFLARGLWSQAHPYSVSALPHPPYLRVTIKDLGDHSAALARLRPGTPIAVEGPYGAFTRHARSRDAVLLAGAGVWVTPLRALLEDLPAHVDVTMLVRASTPADLILRDEIWSRRGARGPTALARGSSNRGRAGPPVAATPRARPRPPRRLRLRSRRVQRSDRDAPPARRAWAATAFTSKPSPSDGRPENQETPMKRAPFVSPAPPPESPES